VADHQSRPEAPALGSVPPAEELRRKPYHRPQILSRESLELMAAVCTGPRSKSAPGIGNYSLSGVIKS